METLKLPQINSKRYNDDKIFIDQFESLSLNNKEEIIRDLFEKQYSIDSIKKIINENNIQQIDVIKFKNNNPDAYNYNSQVYKNIMSSILDNTELNNIRNSRKRSFSSENERSSTPVKIRREGFLPPIGGKSSRKKNRKNNTIKKKSKRVTQKNRIQKKRTRHH